MNHVSLLSGKVVSFKIDSIPFEVGIDRIEGQLSEHINLNDRANSRLITKKYMVGYGYVSTIEIQTGYIYFVHGSKDNPYPKKYFLSLTNSLNPLAHIQQVISIFPEIMTARTTRVDINADFSTNLMSLRRSIRVRNKRLESEYLSYTSKIRGHKYGSEANELIRIYSKNKNKSRIEIQLRNKKLPEKRDIFDIFNWLESYDPFKNIEFWNLNNEPMMSLLSKEEIRLLRKITPVTICENFGLNASRRYHNNRRNFFRDISKHLNLVKAKLDLDNIFQQQVTNYKEVL